jgi:Bacterial Ig-like domain
MAAEGHNGGNSPSENPTRVRSFLRRVGPWSGQWHRLEGQGAQVDGWRPRVGRLSLSLEAAKVLGVVTDALRKRVARGTSTRTTALLAAICTALLTLIAVNPAFGVLVGRFQAENMTESSASISVVPDPDGTGPAGPNLKWASGAGVADTASQSISVPTGSPVDQIQLFTRQSSGGTAVFAIYVQDGTAAANKVGTFSPPAGGSSKWGISTVNLSTAIQPGTHTLYIGPNATFSNNAFIDWFELHSTTMVDTTPPDTTLTNIASPTNDNTPTFSFSGSDNVGVTGFECQVDTAGFVACTSPFTTAALPDGSHTFQVRAKDAAGNVDPTPASQTFTVDTDASSPSGGRPGVGTGVASDCDVTINPGTSTLQTALDNVPTTISTNDYVICMHAGVYGGLAQATDFGNTGDNSTHRLVLKSYPGEQAQFRGFLKATSGDTWYVIRDLYLDARYEAPASGGGVTNAGNPNMMPVYSVAGSDVLFTNNDVDGGNDDRTVVSGSNPLNKRSTCIGYHQDPIRSTVSHNWIHNCGVLAANSASGGPDAHGLYTSNAANGGTVSDNFIWGNAEVGLNAFGTSVGPHGVIFEDNIVWDNFKNMVIGGAASGNTVRNSLFLDPYLDNARNIMGTSTGAPTAVIDNCLDSAIRATNVNTSGNVIVPDASMSFSGDPRNGDFTITTTSECLAKYGGTMYP